MEPAKETRRVSSEEEDIGEVDAPTREWRKKVKGRVFVHAKCYQ